MFKRNEKASVTATSHVEARIDVSIDPNMMDSIQYMIYHEALMALKNIHQILSSVEIKSKSHTDIDKETNQYRFACRLEATTDESILYSSEVSIVLTTSTGSVEESNSELVKLVHDIETLCREKG